MKDSQVICQKLDEITEELRRSFEEYDDHIIRIQRLDAQKDILNWVLNYE